ncbi:MAG: hypothetical protein HOQ22_09915 [Nocardioidaceae bacterium]|nr:hypothetical protein [Nocardioidaceae bacterium]NUS51339.1 hypothetical protein [Nocardioidaceae bacterium]
MEHVRCAQCRNPVRARQVSVAHVRSALVFHADCWVDLHAQVQAEYLRGYDELGVAALMTPYERDALAAWLPEAAIDEAVEELSAQLQHLPPMRVQDVG